MSIFGSEYLLEVEVPSDEDAEDYAIADNEDEEETPDDTEDTPDEPEEDASEEDTDESEEEGDDYTLDGDEEEDESEEGDDDASEEDISDTEDDIDDESLTGEIQDGEDELMSDLSDTEKDIRDKELKELYVNLHNSISNILMKVDRVVKTIDNIKTLNYCENRLNKVQEMLYDYLLDSYKTKSYIQNLTMYYQLIGTLTGIEQLLNSLTDSADTQSK